MAARRLGLLGDKAEAAIPALLDCLTGQAPPNGEALRALHRIPFTTADELRRLVAALRTTALARNRDRARDGLIDLFRLLGSRAQAVAPELARGLRENPRQSLAFAFALAAVEALAEVAGSHLAVLGRSASKALLARLPGSEEKGSRARKRRERVLTLLAGFDEVDADALEFAAKYAAHKRIDLRLAAFAVLRAIGPPARPLAGEVAAGLSDGTDRPARMEFLAAVAPLPADAKLVALSFMGDPDPATRDAVTTLLSKDPITTKAELDALARGIQSTSTPGVIATLHAIRSAGVRLEWKAPWLIDATKDEVPDVRMLGIDALGILGAAEKDGRVVQPIASCLADRNEGVKLIAAGTLGTLGTLAKPALPALRQCFQDESWRVREATLAAVKQIENALK